MDFVDYSLKLECLFPASNSTFYIVREIHYEDLKMEILTSILDTFSATFLTFPVLKLESPLLYLVE